METIKLDLIPGKKMPSLHASQYDDGREHGIDLFENGVVYKLDGTATLTINERKGDDCICSLDIENTFEESNHIVFASTEQMCAVWGNNICELVIAKGEKTIGTLNFILEIELSPTENGIESESEIKNLERQIEAITEEVIGDNYYTAEETDEAIATATEGKADKTYVDTELDKKADKIDTYTKTQVDNALNGKADKATTYTKTEVDTLIDNLPEPMIFKGTLGVGGTIQTLPTASASNEGFTYKVITDGTYAGQTAKVGDVFTSNGSAWVYIPSGDEDNDTWRAIKVNGTEELGSGISSGSVDFVGSENIDVEFDSDGNKIGIKTKNIYTESEVDDIVYNILPDDTASGSVANFTTSLELPLKSLEVDVNAVQSAGTPTPATPLPISGRSEISLVKAGANLWDEVWELGTINNQTGQNVDDSGMYRSKNYIQVPQGENLYLFNGNSDTLGLRFYDSNKAFISARAFLTSKAMTYGTNDLPTGTAYIRFVNTSTNAYLNNIAINYPSSDNAYHAFNGNTEVISLGGTYYGGHFTQDKAGHRQFVATHEYETNMGQYNYAYVSASNCFRTTNFNKAYKRTAYTIIANSLCSHYGGAKLQEVLNQSANNSTYAFGIVGLYNGSVLFRNTNYSDATAFKSSMQGVTMTFELETPIIIDLPDGEPIATLVGTNNVYADSGNIEVTYKKSIDDAIAELQALILNA